MICITLAAAGGNRDLGLNAHLLTVTAVQPGATCPGPLPSTVARALAKSTPNEFTLAERATYTYRQLRRHGARMAKSHEN